MFCKNCGKEIDDRAAICPYCGVPVNTAATAVGTPEKHINGIGIAGFVVSILSLWLGMYYVIASLVALGLSIAAFCMRKKYNSCNGLAIAGLVISIVSTTIWLFIYIVVIAVLGAVLF